jgi:hypothetical protein
VSWISTWPDVSLHIIGFWTFTLATLIIAGVSLLHGLVLSLLFGSPPPDPLQDMHYWGDLSGRP